MIYKNNNLLKTARDYEKIIHLMRQWFFNNHFLEVFTPQLVVLPGMEPNLVPFKTCIQSFCGKKTPAYLITSPEYAMKKLLAEKFPAIYQITSSFRNAEDNSPIHSPEFKILEWYRPQADYMDIAKDTENLIYFINKKFSKKNYLIYQNKKINLAPPWEHITCEQAFFRYAKVDLKKLMKKKNFEDEFYKIFLTNIEPKLGFKKPTIIMDYPASMAALSLLKNKNFAERWELYISGIEIANCFSELTNWREQEKRLKKEQTLRRKLGREIYAIDSSFIHALKEGLPRTGGIALGVDRLIMMLTNKKSLTETTLF